MDFQVDINFVISLYNLKLICLQKKNQAAIGPGIFLVAASYASTSVGAVILFSIAMTIMGCFYCSIKVNPNDLSSNYAGTIMGIVNGIGTLAGFIAPITAGLLTPNVNSYHIFFI